MIQIPSDAKVIRDARLTIVRTISTLHDRMVGGKGGLKEKIVADMLRKKAGFAESDHVIARLVESPARSKINPAKFYRLVKAGKITEQQFLGSISVTKAAAEEILAPADIAAISESAGEPTQALFSEFKPGISAAVDELDLSGLLLKMLLRQVNGAAA